MRCFAKISENFLIVAKLQKLQKLQNLIKSISTHSKILIKIEFEMDTKRNSEGEGRKARRMTFKMSWSFLAIQPQSYPKKKYA